jgi:hypothetical protein
MESFELSPDGCRSIEFYRTLEQAIERAQVLLSSRSTCRSSGFTPAPAWAAASWGS